MGKRSRQGGLPREYEGEAVLGALLEAAGSSLEVEEVKALIRDAQAEKAPPSEVFPDLFDEEPRFGSPDEALRLYSNLFGLWDRIEAGGPIEPASTQAKVKREKPPRAPRPAPIAEGPLDEAFVEAAWRYLADFEPREHERLLHRFENTQPELSEWVRSEAGDSIATLETADLLAFELWAMLELARPGSRPPISLKQLQSAEGAPTSEPALEAYVEEAIAEAALDDENPLSDEEAAQVRRLARAVIGALTA